MKKGDAVDELIYDVMSGHGLTKKKQMWYEIHTGGIRAVSFSRSRWRDKDNQEYDPELCFYPMEFLGDWSGKVPPSYEFPIRMSPMYSLGPKAWKEIKPAFDNAIEMEYAKRKKRIEFLLLEHFRPKYLKMTSFKRVQELYYKGILPDFAFAMPARQFILDKR
ncbi:MAG: hypothetical protein ABJ327_11180 [Litoreibacter sp.]